MSDSTSSHPGLGAGTDISVTNASTEEVEDAPVAATLDPEQRRDDDLGAGDGVDVQPGGAG